MRRRLILSAVIALLLAAASVPLAFAGGDPGDEDDETRVIEVTTKTVQDITQDLPPAGDGIGDRFVQSSELFRGGDTVGTAGIDCVAVLFKPGATPTAEPVAVTVLCTAALSLSRGQITVQGLVDFTAPGPSFTLAVTGGTGAYREARGEVEVTSLSETEDRLQITLVDD